MKNRACYALVAARHIPGKAVLCSLWKIAAIHRPAIRQNISTFLQVPVYYCMYAQGGYRWKRINSLGSQDQFKYPFMVEEEALVAQKLLHSELCDVELLF